LRATLDSELAFLKAGAFLVLFPLAGVVMLTVPTVLLLRARRSGLTLPWMRLLTWLLLSILVLLLGAYFLLFWALGLGHGGYFESGPPVLLVVVWGAVVGLYIWRGVTLIIRADPQRGPANSGTRV